MYCSYCQARNSDDGRYCWKCGRPLTSDHENHPHHADPELEASPPQYQRSPLNGPATELWLSKDAVLANRYRIERELGEGGMGRVYAAWDDELECQVAIKTLRQILGTDALLAKRLKAEAKLSMDLTHPNIVRVHNLELNSRIKFLVMEYVEGESLAQRIGREEKLGEEETRRTAIEICKGLEHVHDQNIIHRDLKSANILLGKNGAVTLMPLDLSSNPYRPCFSLRFFLFPS